MLPSANVHRYREYGAKVNMPTARAATLRFGRGFKADSEFFAKTKASHKPHKPWQHHKVEVY